MEAEYKAMLSELDSQSPNISTNAGNGHHEGEEESTISGLKRKLVSIQKKHLEEEQSWRQERFEKETEITRLQGVEGKGQLLRLELEAKEAELKEAEELKTSEISNLKKELRSRLEKLKELAEKEVQRLGREKAECQQKLQDMAKSMKAVEAQRKVALEKNERLVKRVSELDSRIGGDAKKLKKAEEDHGQQSSEITGLQEDLEDVKGKEEGLQTKVQDQSTEIEDLRAKLEQEKRDGEKRVEETSQELRNTVLEHLEQLQKAWKGNPKAGFSGFQGQGSGQPLSKPVHEEDPQNALACLCTRTFGDVGSLQRHVKYENGCYPCPPCEMEFKTSGQLKAHEKSKRHIDQSRSSASAAKRPRREVQTDNEEANGNENSEDDDADATDREVTNGNEEGGLNEDEQVDVESVLLSDISVGGPESME